MAKTRIYSAMPLPIRVGMTAAVTPPTLRFVARRAQVASGSASTVQSLMSRSALLAETDISTLRIAWANWQADTTLSGAPGNVLTVKASVEYPAGVFTQVKFSGVAAGVAPPITTLWSDDLGVSIPKGSTFWVRTWQVGTVGILFNSLAPNITLGEASNFPGSDQTLSGTVATGAGIFGPCAVVGLSSAPAALLLGDSRTAGIGDNNQSATGSFGLGSGFNPYAWSAIGVYGTTSAQYIATAGALQADLAQYATDIINLYGINDFFAGASAATLKARLTTIRALYPTKKYHVITLGPSADSNNLWVDLPGQTPFANNAERVAHNTNVRADSLGFDPFFDYAAISESSLNSGKWAVDGTANKYTADGTHESPYCYALYASAGFTL